MQISIIACDVRDLIVINRRMTLPNCPALLSRANRRLNQGVNPSISQLGFSQTLGRCKGNLDLKVVSIRGWEKLHTQRAHQREPGDTRNHTQQQTCRAESRQYHQHTTK